MWRQVGHCSSACCISKGMSKNFHTALLPTSSLLPWASPLLSSPPPSKLCTMPVPPSNPLHTLFKQKRQARQLPRPRPKPLPSSQPSAASPAPSQACSPSPEPQQASPPSPEPQQASPQPPALSANPSGKAPKVPVQYPCSACINQGLQCKFTLSSRSMKCQRCYKKLLGPCRVTSKPLETHAMVAQAEQKVAQASQAQVQVHLQASNTPRQHFAKRSKPFPKPPSTSGTLSQASSTPLSTSSKKRSFTHVISDSGEEDEPLSFRRKPNPPSSNLPKLPQPSTPAKQQQQPDPSFSKASQPHPTTTNLTTRTRRRPLPRVTSTPWLAAEKELREALWEAFERVRAIHRSMEDPQLRKILLHFDSELEELLHLMGGADPSL